MIIRIQDNPTIVVFGYTIPVLIKPDANPVIVTGSSYYQFTGVTPTVVTDVQTGNLHTISIFTPSG